MWESGNIHALLVGTVMHCWWGQLLYKISVMVHKTT